MKTNVKGKNEGGEKKGFDKKKWRERKFSHKFKVQQFEERRKKKVMRNYYKELKHIQGKPLLDPAAITSDSDEAKNVSSEQQNQHSQKMPPSGKVSTSQRVRQEFERIRQQKEDKKKELEMKKAEKEQKLLEYKAKKAERFRKLSKKTKKGQPVMKDRLEMLLEKIQKQCK
ncbi:thyroid transcription factor 1-associated protein 26 [Neocloeon triangulifer]|uniref:thyroid transcription factor 1-associated protein 26 n=1 Tax=Neocloeon triangulifer TaxID=2078957 RepID=UPI00286F6EC9|nr:thyroid transcription factor 1-associated protein 26 [Neocloeon triangulifer]